MDMFTRSVILVMPGPFKEYEHWGCIINKETYGLINDNLKMYKFEGPKILRDHTLQGGPI